MIFIHAHTQRVADAWAREQGLRPHDCRTYGDLGGKSTAGAQYRPGDRIIILGDVSERLEAAIRVFLRKCPQPRPVIERHETLPIPR